jgi:hypothetical protein
MTGCEYLLRYSQTISHHFDWCGLFVMSSEVETSLAVASAARK